MSIVTYKRGDKTALTKNFTRDEFECQCKKCDAQMIDLELVDKLQSIRDVLGVKLKVTSGYRCITHNAKVHGSSHSKHLYGFAADWRTLDRVVNPVALGIIAQAVGFGGIGIYWHSEAAMCHADTAQARQPGSAHLRASIPRRRTIASSCPPSGRGASVQRTDRRSFCCKSCSKSKRMETSGLQPRRPFCLPRSRTGLLQMASAAPLLGKNCRVRISTWQNCDLRGERL